MWRIYLLLCVVTVIAGLTPIGARMATTDLAPLTVGFLRFSAAGLLWLATARAFGVHWSLSRRDWITLTGLGALCVPINQFGFLQGIKFSNASHAGIAYALVPVLVYWISLALRRTSLTMRMALASTLAFAGAAATILSTSKMGLHADSGPTMILGDLLLLSAATSWAFFVVFSQPVVKRIGAVRTLTAVFLIGSMLQVPLVVADALFFDLRAFEVPDITGSALVGFAFITLVTAYSGYMLWYLVIARYDVTGASIFTNASFLITVAVEATFVGQSLSWGVGAGSALLLFGVVLATYRRQSIVRAH